MASNINLVGTLVKLEPERAKVLILKAFKDNDESWTAAAKALKVTYRTMRRWRLELDL